MSPPHIPVFLSEKPSTASGIVRPAIVFLAWVAGSGRLPVELVHVDLAVHRTVRLHLGDGHREVVIRKREPHLAAELTHLRTRNYRE